MLLTPKIVCIRSVCTQTTTQCFPHHAYLRKFQTGHYKPVVTLLMNVCLSFTCVHSCLCTINDALTLKINVMQLCNMDACMYTCAIVYTYQCTHKSVMCQVTIIIIIITSLTFIITSFASNKEV